MRGGFCNYVAAMNQRSNMHEVVTGFTRKDVFESAFMFVAKGDRGWRKNHGDAGNRTFDLSVALASAGIAPAGVKK